MADFYRELGHLFGVVLSPNNRWHSSKTLREKWRTHIEAAAYRRALIIDEAEETNSWSCPNCACWPAPTWTPARS